jgi:hypothetical protein
LRQKWGDVEEVIIKSTTVWLNKGALSTVGIDIERFILIKNELVKKKCQCCGFSFTLFKRKQKCSVCTLGYCDACSKKKVSVADGSTSRCCDSCYNIISKLCGDENERLFMAGGLKNLPSSSFGADSATDIDATNKKKKENLMREAVLASNAHKGENENTKHKKTASELYGEGGMSALKAHLGEAHEKLHERGEKLNELNDKSDRLKNSANEFAKLAQQLNKDRSGSWW